MIFLFLIGLYACGNSRSDSNAADTASTEVQPDLWVEYEPQSEIDKKKKIVLVSGDEEYRSEEALPQLGRILSDHHGFHCTVLFAQDPSVLGTINPNYLENIPGLESLADADLMILFTRFRALPADQMQHIDHYLKAGKPVLGIRTATHAFNIKDSTDAYVHYGNYYKGDQVEWVDGFGRLVLGEHWHTHHGHHKHQSTRGILAPGADNHPITSSITSGDIWGSTDVYGVRLPLPGDAIPIILGQVVDRTGAFDEDDLFFGMKPSDDEIASINPASKEKYDPNDPMMPIAWTKSYQLPGGRAGKAFTSTIGASTDLLDDGVRRLLVNATYWLLDLEVPAEANVELVGPYQPSQYSFHKEENYWQNKGMKVSDFAP
ncbi:MAG: hypothetical protein HKN87_23375 [Saprospiraceae bacterium]|nr:hypothetical protein [Saprospiraceae bacterium]